MSRKVPEWKGATHDSQIPPRVKVRLFERFHGRCNHCGTRIVGGRLPAYDHITPLIGGGENRESNLQLLCSPCHGTKTKIDVAEKSKLYHKKVKAIGIRRKRRTIPGRRFDGTPVPSKWK